MIAKNIAPGLQRNFAFQAFRNFDADLWNELIHEAQTKTFAGKYQLFGSDSDETVLSYAKENAERAGVAECISFSVASFPPSSSGGLLRSARNDDMWILTNPPYGKRLSADDDLTPLYQQLASSFQNPHQYGGVISSYPALSALFPTQKFSHKSLYNGADKVDFYRKKPL
jgi:putative N6-adenine-specific DNA methylase